MKGWSKEWGEKEKTKIIRVEAISKHYNYDSF